MNGHAKTDDAAIDQQASAEARAAARSASPLLLLALLLLRYVLPNPDASVNAAFGVQLGAIALRWATLSLLAPRGGRKVRPRAWHGYAVTATAWATSAGVANILLKARDPSSIQLLELTLVCTAVCAIAQRSMAPHLLSYGGYVLIQFAALLTMIMRAPDRSLVPIMPTLFAGFVVALSASALRARGDLRERIRLTMELHDSSLRDGLTGLRNRRFAVAFAEQRAAHLAPPAVAGRREPPSAPPELAFLLVDLDHFKAVNDTYGHAAGDAVLAGFAAVATKTLRAHDVLARWGGEEFLAILELPDADDAKHVAERLRQALAHASFEVAPGVTIRVTCSIGGALLPRLEGQTSWQETINRADARLYRAKASGRDQVCWSDDADAETSDARASASMMAA